MNKIKIIKRNNGVVRPPSLKKKQHPRKPRSIETTIQGWITERRENSDTEQLAGSSTLSAWNTLGSTAEVI